MTYTFLADMIALVAANKGGSGNGNGVQVVITPRGRAPYLVPLAAPPEWSVQAFGGYGAATIRQRRVSGDTSAHLLYADVTIWGRQGPCYRGIVKETERDGTLHCAGIHEVLGWHHSAEVGPSTDYSAFTEHILGAHLPDWLTPPAASAFVQNNPLVLASALTLEAGPLAEQIAKWAAYSDYEYGWYFERIGGQWVCVPHFAPASTTPDYVVTLSAEDAAAFMGDSLESMTSKVITEWSAGTSVSTDDDPNHYLVQIGREKASYISSPNTGSDTDAALIAAQRLLKRAKTKAGRTAARRAIRSAQRAGVRGRARLSMTLSYGSRGSAATSRIQTASGLDAYGPSIRPGCLVRLVGLPDGAVDVRLAGIDCDGDMRVSLDFGTDSGRLDALLARVGG